MTLIAKTVALMKQLKAQISSKLQVEDNGPLHWLLGIEIQQNRNQRTITFSQKAYIDAIIKKYGFTEAKPLTMPADPHVQLSPDQSPNTSQEINMMKSKPYAEAVGSLNYASIATWPNISYAVNQVARYNSNPGQTHWTAVKRIFQYLKSTNNMWLVLGRNEEQTFEGYSDSDGMST